MNRKITLGGWNFYFLAKLLLFFRHEIGLHPLENLGFAAFLLIPVDSPRWRKARLAVSIPLAAALLYYDSWLPPFSRAISQASLIYSFSLPYLMELAGRFINGEAIAALVIAYAAYRLVSMRIKIGVLVVGTLIFLLFSGKPQTLTPVAAVSATSPTGGNLRQILDGAVASFFAREAGRSVTFASPGKGEVPFDVVFIHVCSLAWDDVKAVGLDSHPLWGRFDFLFTNFNSASTYSGPAAIRVLRSTCGQQQHADLYSPVPGKCYLMDSLKASGFAPNFAMNHDGHFDDFLKTVQAQGEAMNMTPISDEGIRVDQHAFDDSPIYDDLGVLSRWLEGRKQNDAPRVALYYNTISLHDGNHMLGENAGKGSRDTYKLRLSRLLDQIDEFMRRIETSGRKVVVVMVPEHGAAYRGDRMQIPGLREIPTPAITLIPVGIKVAGGGREGGQARIDSPSSFLAMTTVISKMLEKSPYDSKGFSASDYAGSLPETDYVAENQNMLMLRKDNRYYLRQDPDGWSEYTP